MEQNPPAKPGASGPLIRIEPITGQHDLSCFSCSEQELNDFLTTDALTDHTSLYSITRLVHYNGTLAGFFTLIADNISVTSIPSENYVDYHYQKLPAVKIARLAVDKKFERQGIGRRIITEIFRIVYEVSQQIGCRVITVDAKENALGFYKKFAFMEVESKKHQDYIPMYLDFRTLMVKGQSAERFSNQ